MANKIPMMKTYQPIGNNNHRIVMRPLNNLNQIGFMSGNPSASKSKPDPTATSRLEDSSNQNLALQSPSKMSGPTESFKFKETKGHSNQQVLISNKANDLSGKKRFQVVMSANTTTQNVEFAAPEKRLTKDQREQKLRDQVKSYFDNVRVLLDSKNANLTGISHRDGTTRIFAQPEFTWMAPDGGPLTKSERDLVYNLLMEGSQSEDFKNVIFVFGTMVSIAPPKAAECIKADDLKELSQAVDEVGGLNVSTEELEAAYEHMHGPEHETFKGDISSGRALLNTIGLHLSIARSKAQDQGPAESKEQNDAPQDRQGIGSLSKEVVANSIKAVGIEKGLRFFDHYSGGPDGFDDLAKDLTSDKDTQQILELFADESSPANREKAIDALLGLMRHAKSGIGKKISSFNANYLHLTSAAEHNKARRELATQVLETLKLVTSGDKSSRALIDFAYDFVLPSTMTYPEMKWKNDKISAFNTRSQEWNDRVKENNDQIENAKTSIQNRKANILALQNEIQDLKGGDEFKTAKSLLSRVAESKTKLNVLLQEAKQESGAKKSNNNRNKMSLRERLRQKSLNTTKKSSSNDHSKNIKALRADIKTMESELSKLRSKSPAVKTLIANKGKIETHQRYIKTLNKRLIDLQKETDSFNSRLKKNGELVKNDQALPDRNAYIWKRVSNECLTVEGGKGKDAKSQIIPKVSISTADCPDSYALKNAGQMNLQRVVNGVNGLTMAAEQKDIDKVLENTPTPVFDHNLNMGIEICLDASYGVLEQRLKHDPKKPIDLHLLVSGGLRTGQANYKGASQTVEVDGNRGTNESTKGTNYSHVRIGKDTQKANEALRRTVTLNDGQLSVHERTFREMYHPTIRQFSTTDVYPSASYVPDPSNDSDTDYDSSEELKTVPIPKYSKTEATANPKQKPNLAAKASQEDLKEEIKTIFEPKTQE
ncbi:hypothetical protein SCOR_02135 [Sulfidibacter corallicola]|uniref:Uncharacterized protein n=1 Tax=Sulfidibacter corallicola TaxID=2818388 RepID=A0A8A4TIQ8_SULCO|nr:hypothetical protein [Sulfidibacter corallicola]QTD48678.1 hypothetical protein J3U87_24110 [Sulfidibacter corallicola]